ncbi:MAG TPA: TolC family protein [Bryobacteraceae bacterium]|nr:TolC family protein [Bryobacteraceae bacterium]
MPRTKLLLFLAAAAPLLAQDGQQLLTRPPVLRLSLKQAVQLALAPEGSTRVKLAEEDLEQAESRADQSRAALLPDFEGSLQYQNETVNLKAFGFDFPKIPIPGFAIPTFVGPFSVLDVRASVNQTVFDFSSIRRYQASKVAVEATKADNEGTNDQVSDQVARAYLAGLRAQASVDTQRANVELSESLLRLAQQQKTAGTGTGIEITRAEVQLANDRQALLVAENDLDRTRLQLLKVIGLKLDNPVELVDRLAYIPMETVDPAQALATASQHRAELRAQQRREENARLSASATKLERLPSVSAFANYGDIGSSVYSVLPTRSIGASVKIPIFDGGRRDARRVESASLFRSESIRTADLRDQIELDVRVAIDSLHSADAQVKAAEEGLTLAENEVAQAERRYKAGVSNSVEVTDAQTRLARARDNRINALYNYNLARIDLGTATGTIQSMIH